LAQKVNRVTRKEEKKLTQANEINHTQCTQEAVDAFSENTIHDFNSTSTLTN